MFSFPGTQKYFIEYTSEPFADVDVRVGVAICHGWRRRFEFEKQGKYAKFESLNVCPKSGGTILFRRNPKCSFTELIWESTSVFSAVDTDTPGAVSGMFSCGASVFFLLRLGNPADDFRIPRSLSSDHLTHQLFVDLDTGTARRNWCGFVFFF